VKVSIGVSKTSEVIFLVYVEIFDISLFHHEKTSQKRPQSFVIMTFGDFLTLKVFALAPEYNLPLRKNNTNFPKIGEAMILPLGLQYFPPDFLF
jgi:hypothetical protein